MSDTLTAKSAFADLLRDYDAADTEHARLKTQVENAENAKNNLRDMLRSEVISMGLTRGSSLVIEDLGKFNFTKKAYYAVPGEYREEFTKLLLDEGSESLLTVGKADLRSWCEDRDAREVPLPHYIVVREDKFVPSISLESAKARTAAKRRSNAGEPK